MSGVLTHTRWADPHCGWEDATRGTGDTSLQVGTRGLLYSPDRCGPGASLPVLSYCDRPLLGFRPVGFAQTHSQILKGVSGLRAAAYRSSLLGALDDLSPSSTHS